MATTNTFLTPDIIAREALAILENNLISPQIMNTDIASEFTGAKVGDTISIRKPAFFVAKEFESGSLGNSSSSVTMQDVVEHSVSLKIEKLFDVSFEVTTKELALDIDQFNSRLLTPAMAALTQQIDSYAMGKLNGLAGLPQFANGSYTNTMSKAPEDLPGFAQIVEAMNKGNIPVGGRKMVLSPAMQTKMYEIDSFIRADIRGGGFSSPIQEASLGRYMGLDMMMSQNLASHTVGTANADSGTLTINGDGYEGQDSIQLNGATDGSATLKAGDTISILYNDGNRRDHVVTEDTTLGGTIKINPLNGHDQAVLVQGTGAKVVADTASVKVKAHADDTSWTVGAAFVPEAMQVVFIPMPEPMGPGTSSATVSYNGMSIRVLQTYDHLKKKDMISLDCMVGAKAVDARLGVKVVSNAG